MKLSLFSLAVLLPACPSQTTPPIPEIGVVVIEGGTDSCAQACSAMAAASCPEGLASDCAATCRTIQSRPNFATDMNVSCLVKAKTSSDVKACGIACSGH
jgi:hypothetical protein